jgi:hypothetical protein
MELSSEDALRLNVLLANKPLAIRINESSMTLYGLLENGEASVSLNAPGSDDSYLKSVRAFLSERALGSPGGYPLYLQRWSRQGQMREQSLEQLLLLGDATAVFAVVCAENLSDEMARRAWWASEEAENARCMLQCRAVVEGEMGPVLARYLVEYLPFETEAETIMVSISLALQPGLLDEAQRMDLWKKAGRKTPILVGFISAIPDDLPGEIGARPDHAEYRDVLDRLAKEGIEVASLLGRVLSQPGQRFMEVAQRILAKPPTQDVVNTTLDILRNYCTVVRPEGDPDLNMEELLQEADEYLCNNVEVRRILTELPDLENELRALRILSGLGYGILRPLLKGSSAIGSLMRRKLEPALTPLLDQLNILRNV